MTHHELTASPPDSMTQSGILPYKNKLDLQMDEFLVYCDSALTKDGYESTLSNFVLSAEDYFISKHYPSYTKVVSTVNRGGLRINLPAGKITVRTIYELMPFDNEIVLLTVSGENLQKALETFSENGKLFTNNISFSIENKYPGNIKIYNENIDKSQFYLIATTDYLANGGDNCHFFANPLKYEATGVKLRDVIIDYCRYLHSINKSISPYKNGRISVSK